ncbi:MAG: hypothetical protein ACJA0N_000881 [Pseudohongiellaceae bacterium]|jgi:hypothetical protein
MKIKDLSEFKPSDVELLLRRIPFFKELQNEDTDQLSVLMDFSCIVELDPGETIMRRGDRGSWLYFLIKGGLSVYLDSPHQGEPLNHITPGELFGDLALLCDHERKATVAADNNGKPATLFATDFKPFGDIHQFETVSLHTKLIFYRTMVHSIRWRLEQKRMENGHHELAKELRQVKFHGGEKETPEELESLFEQAQQLASILDRWNTAGAEIQDVVVAVTASKD